MPKVNIQISATDDASTILRKVTTAINETNKSTGSMTGSVIKGNIAFDLMKRGVEGVKDATIGLTMASLKSFGTMEQNEIALRTMLGSQEKMVEVLGQVTKAAKETPFEMQDLVTGAKNLIAFGEGADTVVDTMKMIGDVSAGLSIPINDLITKFGQIRTQGRAMTMDLREFASRGVPIYKALSETMNVTEAEVMSLATAGKVGFTDIQNAFKNMTKEGGTFGGLMEAQSKSLNGMISNLSDSYDILLTKLGKEMEGEARRGISAVSKALEEGGLFNAILTNMAETGKEAMGILASGVELLDSNFRKANGTAEDFNEGLEYLETAAMWEKVLAAETAGLSRLFGNQAEEIKKTKAQYEAYIASGISGAAELNAINSKIEQDEIARRKRLRGSATGKTAEDKQSATQEIENWRKKRDEAVKYYNDIVFSAAMAEASDLKRIDLTTQKELENLEEKRKYLTSYQYQQAKGLITYKALQEADTLRVSQTADMFDKMSSIQTNFYTSSSSEAANAWGKMSGDIVKSWQDVSGVMAGVFKDIAADSRKTGISMGDGFKIGASVAVAALQSVNAVLAMQSQMVQANYQRQIDALQAAQEKELELLEEKYSEQSVMEDEFSTLEEERRLLELEEYTANLQGKTDEEINRALKKKAIDIQSAEAEKALQKKKDAEEKERDKKKAEEAKIIKEKFEMEKWKLEVSAFNAKKEADRNAVIMATAIGVVQAWAGAMQLSPVIPAIIAVGGALTGLMVGTAAKQLSLIDSQKPPAPPAFADGVTNFEGGLALVGERGRELVSLPAGSNVVTNENTERLLNSGAQYIVNNIYVNGILTQQEIVDTRKSASYGGY